MTDRFLKFLPFIIEWETEYYSDGRVRVAHDPDDPGGTTKYGIDPRSHPGVDIENLTYEGASEIYSNEWDASGAEAMKPGLGEAYFNSVVNAGKGRADILYARSDLTWQDYLQKAADFYRGLAEEHPRFQKYLKGWLNRVHALYA